MASERSTEHLIDLLYDELTEEEEISLRQELEGSAEMRNELASLKAIVGEVEASIPTVDLPPGLHEAIMAAAEAELATSLEKEARAIRLPATHEQPMGIWRRLRGTQISQVALVATVLFAGAFVFRYLGDSPVSGPMEFESRLAPASFSADKSVEAPAPADDPLAETAEENVGIDVAQPAASPPAPKLAMKEKPALEDLLKDTEAKKGGGERALETRSEERKTVKRKRSSKQSKVAAEKSPAKTASKKPDLDVFAGDDDAFGSARGNAVRTKSDGSSAGKQEARAAEIQTTGASNADPAPIQAPAEAEAPPTDSKVDAYRPEPGSLDAVESSYETGDYRGTISSSDRVLSSSAPATQKARALELKAQAYMRMGQLQQADSTYRNLQTNYPNYNSSRVKGAREDLSRRLSKNRSKSNKAKPAKKKTYDFESSNQEAPSSLQ